MSTSLSTGLPRLAPLTLALLLAACGGGSDDSSTSGSGNTDDSGGGSTPEPTPATLSLAVSQLPAGASVTLEQLSGDSTLATLAFTADGTTALAEHAAGNVLRIASVTPAAPQTHLLQCAFAATDLGTVQDDGSLVLSQAASADSSISVDCGRVHLAYDWKTDGGTPTGFRQAYVGYLAVDIDNASASWLNDADGNPVLLGRTGATGLSTVLISQYFQGKAWFAATDDTHGKELWSSDGSAAGTQLAIDLYPGTESGSPYDMNPVGNRLFLSGTSSSGIIRLESLDGTTASQVSLTYGGANKSADAYDVLDQTLFIATGGTGNVNSSTNVNGSLLSRNIDSSDDLTLVIKPRATFGDGYRSTGFVKTVGEKLFFGVYNATNSEAGSLRSYLAVTEGTADDIQLLVGSFNLVSGYYETDRDSNLTTLNDELYFVQGEDVQTLGTNAQQQLYKSDGSVDGTVALTSFSNGEKPVVLAAAGDTLYFLAQSGETFSDTESFTLWKVGTDDSAAVQVAPEKTAPAIIHQRNSSAPKYGTHSSLHAAGNRVVYTGTDGHLWGSDGSDDGTARLFPDVADGSAVPGLGACASSECLVDSVTTLDDKVLIAVRVTTDTSVTLQYWLSDGTASGTVAVNDKDTDELLVHSFTLS